MSMTKKPPAMDEDQYNDTDLDFSFTSCASTATTDRTFGCSSSASARTSLARSSLTLSFNDRPSTSTPLLSRPHRRTDPHWSAINAATNLSSDGTLHVTHLKLQRLLGAGDLGRVFLCRLRDNDHASFALKVVDRDALSSKKLCHVQTEAEILSTLDHPFLPTLYAHLDVSHYTCLLIDYCSGGDLHSLLRKQPGNRFSVQAVRFFAAEVLVALEYLHANGIIYRDLKPENVLLRENGHVMLSDFDLCLRADVVPTFQNRRVGPTRLPRSHWPGCFSGSAADREEELVAEFVAEPTEAFSRSCVGTHEYLAPELVSGNGHGNGVDWWAFGVLVYELLYGTTPFKGASKEGTLRNIASRRDVRFPDVVEEEGMAEARDLIGRLLMKDPRRRLGCARGATDVKRHPFFDGIKWPLIRTYKPPEVRGLGHGPVPAKKAKAQVSRNVAHKGKRWGWKRLQNILVKHGGSKNNNSNYYQYINNKSRTLD